MAYCDIRCPYCELSFKHEVDPSEDIYEDQYIECDYCEQTIQLTYDIEVTANISIESDEDELKEMQEIGKQKKSEMFIIKLDDTNYLSTDDSPTTEEYYLNVFMRDHVAKDWIKRNIKTYLHARVLKYTEFKK